MTMKGRGCPRGGPGERRTGTTPDRMERLKKKFGDDFYEILSSFEGVFKNLPDRLKKKEAIAQLKKSLRLRGRECVDLQRLAHG